MVAPGQSQLLPRRMLGKKVEIYLVPTGNAALCQHQSDTSLYTKCDIPISAGDFPVSREIGQKILALKSWLPLAVAWLGD